jgi:hypothetical protein
MTIARVRANWTGFAGASGVSTFYLGTSPTGADLDFIQDFFNGFSGLLASGVVVTVEQSGDTLNEADGVINGSWSATRTQAPATGSGGSNYSGATGIVIRWRTAGVVNGRRVRGATFLVPLSTAEFAAGVPSSGNVALVTSSANGLAQDLNSRPLVIWSRPFAGAPGNPARAGTAHPVTSGEGRNLSAVLRSRRD